MRHCLILFAALLIAGAVHAEEKLDYTGGFRPAPVDDTPYLRVYGDGRVLVHRSIHGKRGGDYQLQLNDRQMRNLLGRLDKIGVIGLTAAEIKAQKQEAIRENREAKLRELKAQAQAEGNANAVIGFQSVEPQVMDAATTVLEVNLNDATHELKWYALDIEVKSYPAVQALQRFDEAVKLLRQLDDPERLKKVE